MVQNEWIARHEKRSSLMLSYLLSQELDDVTGMGKMLRAMWASPDRPSGAMLYGPSGSGKHTAAYHLIKALKQENFGFIFLYGDELEEGLEELSKNIDAVLDNYYDEQRGLCIVFDELSKYKYRRKFYLWLARLSCEYFLQKDILPPLFLIMIEKKDAHLPSLLAGRIRKYRLPLPSENIRKRYLQSNAGDILKYIPESKIVEATEGYDFSNLSGLVSILRDYIDLRDGIVHGDEVAELLESQKVKPHDRYGLRSKISKLLDDLPDLLAGLKINDKNEAFSYHEGNPSKPDTQESFDLGKETERIQNMPVKELAVELWGRERAESLQQSAR